MGREARGDQNDNRRFVFRTAFGFHREAKQWNLVMAGKPKNMKWDMVRRRKKPILNMCNTPFNILPPAHTISLRKTLLQQKQWWLLLPETLLAQNEMNGSLCASQSQWQCVHCNPITTVNSVLAMTLSSKYQRYGYRGKVHFFIHLWATYISVYWSQTIRFAIYCVTILP